jgi:hypothetical protein
MKEINVKQEQSEKPLTQKQLEQVAIYLEERQAEKEREKQENARKARLEKIRKNEVMLKKNIVKY